jgi:hypothetical protein
MDVYFLLKCLFFFVVIMVSTYVVTLREIFTTTDTSTTTKTKNNPKYDALNTNINTEYHMTEAEIRKQEDHKMNVMYVKGENGRPVGINMESTQSFPTYYTPGAFPYSSAAYVPNYEDAVILPLSKPYKQ